MSISASSIYLNPSKFFSEMEYQRQLVEEMIDKVIDEMGKKDNKWVHTILKGEEMYEKAIRSMTCFIPFIERNMGSLLKELDLCEGNITGEQKEILENPDFHERLTINLFNESFIGDFWFKDRFN